MISLPGELKKRADWKADCYIKKEPQYDPGRAEYQKAEETYRDGIQKL